MRCRWCRSLRPRHNRGVDVQVGGWSWTSRGAGLTGFGYAQPGAWSYDKHYALSHDALSRDKDTARREDPTAPWIILYRHAPQEKHVRRRLSAVEDVACAH
eukprot:1160003-Pelagomonas_calceolata.AAC.7